MPKTEDAADALATVPFLARFAIARFARRVAAWRLQQRGRVFGPSTVQKVGCQ